MPPRISTSQRIVVHLFGDIRATKEEIDQYKGALSNLNHAIDDYKSFLDSLDRYAKIMQIKLPTAEWDELMTVQAEFDNVTDLSSMMWRQEPE
jgi:hypothetical protein